LLPNIIPQLPQEPLENNVNFIQQLKSEIESNTNNTFVSVNEDGNTEIKSATRITISKEPVITRLYRSLSENLKNKNYAIYNPTILTNLQGSYLYDDKFLQMVREITGLNVSLKAKLASIQKFEQEVYNKLKEMETSKKTELNEKNSEFYGKDNERTNLEADNRLQNSKLNQTLTENEDLKYNIETGDKIGKMTQDDFDEGIKLIDDLVEIKGKELTETREKIKNVIDRAENVPNYKEEQENNEKFKKQIEELKEQFLKLNTDAECAEMVNNYIIKKKNDVIAERKKYIDLNIELKHEIEAKNTLNDNRIQKKVREANSEEIQEIRNKLEETNQKVSDLEGKIQKEIDKIHNFTKEIIKVNITTKHRKEVEEDLQKRIAKQKEELEEAKKTYEVCEEESKTLKDKIGKEKTDNELLKNRNKLLHEENSAITSKFDFITKNYDFTTNLKKISMEDLKNLAQSNNLVNSTIDTFVDKVGTFKRNNVQSLLFDDNI
jgi:hypothetical protein